jgi:cysteine desulfurase
MVSKLTSKTYLDYAASTPVDPRVLEEMLPYFSESYGNPSSTHTFGQKNEAAVEQAREIMAGILNCTPEEIIFTSCGSESDNLALRGAAFAARKQRNANHILISPVEHHAVSVTAEQLGKVFGFELEYLPVNEYGQVSPESVAEHIRPETAVVSAIFANNEIGSINRVAEIGAVCHEHGVAFHTDAVQAAAHLEIDTQSLNADLISIGAHKFYGPKGIGTLYRRKGTPLISTQTGGGQEFSLRAGTSNVPYIVGQAKAFQLGSEEREEVHAHYLPLRDKIIQTVLDTIPASKLTGHPSQRLPNHASFVFQDVDGNELLMMLDVEGFACSSGSACKTGNPEPSEVLTAIGLPADWGLGSLRVTVGRGTTEEDVDRFLAVLPEVIVKNRAMEVV